MELFRFQSEGVNQLLCRPVVLLADDMGLGKTVQAAAAIRRLFEWQAIRRVLVVTPASLCYNWQDELRRWAPGCPSVIYSGADRFGMLRGGARILIGSYETVASDLRRDTQDGNSFCDIGLDLLVLDEVHRIKTPDSIRSRVLCKLVAARRWGITGTPLENHPRELASVLRFLFPNEYGSAHELEDHARTLALRDRCTIRRTKEKVGIQLPPKTVGHILVGLTPEQDAEYVHALSLVKTSVTEATKWSEAASRLLGGLQRLRRIATVSTSGTSGKMDLICEEVEVLAERGEKVVVFSSFAQLALPVLARRLDRYGAVLYTGKMSQQQRQISHERFAHDPACLVMCASLRAAGVGLTWTSASNVYHLDLWWNPQALRQAEDRVHRIGQTKPVLIKRLVSVGTIEEGIKDLLVAKEEVFRFVIDGEAGSHLAGMPLDQLSRPRV